MQTPGSLVLSASSPDPCLDDVEASMVGLRHKHDQQVRPDRSSLVSTLDECGPLQKIHRLHLVRSSFVPLCAGAKAWSISDSIGTLMPQPKAPSHAPEAVRGRALFGASSSEHCAGRMSLSNGRTSEAPLCFRTLAVGELPCRGLTPMHSSPMTGSTPFFCWPSRVTLSVVVDASRLRSLTGWQEEETVSCIDGNLLRAGAQGE